MIAVKKNRKNKGFTLIELIVVVSIMLILSGFMIPKVLGYQDKAKKAKAVNTARQIFDASIENYVEEEGNLDQTKVSNSILAVTGIISTDLSVVLPADKSTITATFSSDSKIYDVIVTPTENKFSVKEHVTGSTSFIPINSRKGWTLVETIVVIAILFMLVGSILISTEQVVKYQNALEVESCRNNILIFINKSRLYCRNKSKGGDILFDTINNEIKFKMGIRVIARISMPRDFKLQGTNLANGRNSISIDKDGAANNDCTIIVLDKFEQPIRLTMRVGTGYLEIK